MKMAWIILLIVIVLVAGGIFIFGSERGGNRLLDEAKGDDLLGRKYVVDPDDLVGGGPPKGGIGVDKGIPALAEKNIKFVSINEADDFIQDNELVLAINYKGVDRAYPLQIMVWHEIANEKIAGEPVLITYCPLCGSGIAYERKVKEEETRFGVSGKLYNSNLVMYDEKTDSYWTQIEGRAIVGELSGEKLVPISIDTVSWEDYKKSHKEAEVLSQDTGFSRRYGTDPYGSYYTDSFLFSGVKNRDDRVHPKTVVFGIEVSGAFKAYRESDLKKKRLIEDVVNGVNIKVERMGDGIVRVTNSDTGEEIVKDRSFWFAWYAFHPETGLYGVEPASNKDRA